MVLGRRVDFLLGGDAGTTWLETKVPVCAGRLFLPSATGFYHRRLGDQHVLSDDLPKAGRDPRVRSVGQNHGSVRQSRMLGTDAQIYRGRVVGLPRLLGHDGDDIGHAVHGVEISERIVHSVEPEFPSLAASRGDGDWYRQCSVVRGVGDSFGNCPRMSNPVDRFHSGEIAVSTFMGGESLDEGVVLRRGCPVGVHVFKRERVGGDAVGEIFVAVCVAGDCHPVCWRALPATEVRVARVNDGMNHKD